MRSSVIVSYLRIHKLMVGRKKCLAWCVFETPGLKSSSYACHLPWITIVGLPDPGQMRSFT